MENTNDKKTVVIIGAGPAGLTAGLDFVEKTNNIIPILYEMTSHIGGISRTARYKGNGMDIGGHRFFSKSDRVMNWWLHILPIQEMQPLTQAQVQPSTQEQSNDTNSIPKEQRKENLIMLVRERLSRIFYLRKFFDYPVRLNMNTICNLGLWRMFKIGMSYTKAMMFPIRKEKTLQDFMINRFGRKLYETFFKDYTEKVWGVPCNQISAEWGAQRIKGLSIFKALYHAIRGVVKRTGRNKGLADQKNLETSLIEQFIYPKYGPGQLWEEVSRRIVAKGGQVHIGFKAVKLHFEGKNVTEVVFRNEQTGEEIIQKADYVFSTMPVKDLIQAMDADVPENVREVASGLMYRDFITVGLLLKELKVKDPGNKLIRDNWIYMQEPEVRMGRIQVFNNWSPYLVADPNTVWLGLEYFCNEGDALWNKSDAEFAQYAIDEMVKVNMIEKDSVLDHTIIRMPKCYPAYFGTYDRFEIVRDFCNQFPNLFLVGRNGMHRYNNQDHSMLTAMTAVEHVMQGITSKETIWSINTEQEYHEEKKK